MGRDLSDTYSLRQRRCQDCERLFTTAEVPILDVDGEPVTFGSLDTEYNHYMRDWQRRYRGGYQGKLYQRRLKPMAQLSIEVKVRRAEKAA
jgi:hypothetical protein